MSQNSIDLIAEKLDILIRLQAQQLASNLEGQKAKILFLHKAGLSPKIIAGVLGTSSNSVSVALSKARKAGEIEGD